MTINIIIDRLISELNDREINITYYIDTFDKYEFTDSELALFYLELLKNNKYNEIVDIITNKDINANNLDYSYMTFESNKYSIYFNFFYRLIFDNVDDSYYKEFYKMMFWAFHANDNSSITKWRSAIKHMLFVAFLDDFENTIRLVETYDTTYKTIEAGIKANKTKTLEHLICRYLDSNSNYAKRILTGFIDECLLFYNIEKSNLSVQHKLKIIRLLAVNYNLPHVKNFIINIRDNEGSKSIVSTIDAILKKGIKKQNKINSIFRIDDDYVFDSKGVVSFNAIEGQAIYGINEKFDVVINTMPMHTKRKSIYEKFKKKLINSVNSRIVRLEQLMVSGSVIESGVFLSFLHSDYFFNKISEYLIFGIDNDEGYVPFVVDNGDIKDINNNIILLDKKNICILHPINFGKYYNILTSQDSYQPFLQIKRKIYVANESVLKDKKISLSGRIFYKQNFIEAINSNSKYNVKLDMVGNFALFSINNFYCKIQLNDIDEMCWGIEGITFFNKADIKLLKNKYHFENATVIGTIDSITYSEAMLIIYALINP